MAAAMLFQRQRLMPFFGLVVMSFAITALWRPGIAPIETARSFFGVHEVAEIADGKARMLYHGTTIHGAQRLRNDDGTPVEGPPTPLTYYYPGGPLAEAIGATRAAHGGLGPCCRCRARYGVVGLPSQGGELWTFFEIDPVVIRMARDPRLFKFLSSCAPDAPVVVGDARLTLEAAPDRYDLIVLDAFSSDTHTGAPADARSPDGISLETLAAWRDRRAHFQPSPRSRARGGQRRRGRRGWSPSCGRMTARAV